MRQQRQRSHAVSRSLNKGTPELVMAGSDKLFVLCEWLIVTSRVSVLYAGLGKVQGGRRAGAHTCPHRVTAKAAG
jgi:hypothetical protein